MRHSRDPYHQLAELHDRLAEGWSLIGMPDEAETERKRARGLREQTPAEMPAGSQP
jgi:hypothetical protein